MHLSNTKVITAIIWETLKLVLLMGAIYKVRRWDSSIWHNIQSFIKTGVGIQTTLMFGLINFKGCNVGITEGRELRSALLRCGQLAWCTYEA
jgi:amino acid permease